MVVNVFLVVFFAAVTAVQSQSCQKISTMTCSKDDWTDRFDHEGVTECPVSTYITGFLRNLRHSAYSDDDYIHRLEGANCCDSDVAFSSPDTLPQIVHIDWETRNHHWHSCPRGFFLQGLYRTHGSGGLDLITEGVCAKPDTHPREYGHCVDHSVEPSFNDQGWSNCPDHYYLTGWYRGGCGDLHCLDKFRCCRMVSGPPPLTSHDEVKTRMMDITLRGLSSLAYFLGYVYASGCRSEYVGRDFRRQGDTWVADQTSRCTGYMSDHRLSIHYGHWSYELKNIKFGKAVLTELMPQVIDSGTIINDDQSPTTVIIERKEEVVRSVTHITTSQWKQSIDFGFEIGYSSGANTAGPTARAYYNFGYEFSTSTTDSTGKEQKQAFSVNKQKTIAGYSAVGWKLALSKMRRTVAYTATVIPHYTAELRGVLRPGDSPGNYHRKYRGRIEPDFSYRFGNASTPFYRALKQESDRSSDPWLWMDMKTAFDDAQDRINHLTDEKRYEFTLTGQFEEVYGHHVNFTWVAVPSLGSSGHRRRSPAQHNENVTVVRTVARTQAGDPPSVFPDPPQVLLDPGTDYEIIEPMINDIY